MIVGYSFLVYWKLIKFLVAVLIFCYPLKMIGSNSCLTQNFLSFRSFKETQPWSRRKSAKHMNLSCRVSPFMRAQCWFLWNIGLMGHKRKELRYKCQQNAHWLVYLLWKSIFRNSAWMTFSTNLTTNMLLFSHVFIDLEQCFNFFDLHSYSQILPLWKIE